MSYSYNTGDDPHFSFALATVLQTRFIGSSPDSDVPPGPADCCSDCYVLPALAQLVKTDPLKNDTSTIVYNGMGPDDTFTFILEKYVSGVWTTQATLNDNTYGTFIELGDHTSPFLQSFIIDWSLVLNEFEDGFYRVKINQTGIATTTFYSFVWCLKPYTDNRADKSVRMEWILKDRRCDYNDFRFNTDYMDADIPCMIRVGGMFGKLSAEYENQETKYENGFIEKYRVEISPAYDFNSGRYYGKVHELLMMSVVPSKDLVITDYCLRNDYRNVKRLPVLVTSGYKPGYKVNNTTLSRVNLTFKERKWDTGHRFGQ